MRRTLISKVANRLWIVSCRQDQLIFLEEKIKKVGEKKLIKEKLLYKNNLYIKNNINLFGAYKILLIFYSRLHYETS